MELNVGVSAVLQAALVHSHSLCERSQQELLVAAATQHALAGSSVHGTAGGGGGEGEGEGGGGEGEGGGGEGGGGGGGGGGEGGGGGGVQQAEKICWCGRFLYQSVVMLGMSLLPWWNPDPAYLQ
eukprot:GHVS01085574.1.p2 GENE.GHVS01085574.1~~GHVS01085574.1.p2  ORF type:complete len:125 (-),score=71.44 GHVS01085574.1:70-444(-)